MRKLIFSLVIMGVFTSVGWAGLYEGVIADIFDGGQSLKVTHVDDLTKEKKTLFVSIDSKTQILGAASASTLKPGHAISINATEIESNRLSAKSITVISNV